MAEPTKTDIERARLNLAVTCIGECLMDLGRVLQQGPRDDNWSTRGNIALGLERAAAYVRGQTLDRPPDPQHIEQKAGS